MTPEEKVEIIQSGKYDYLDVRQEYWKTEEATKLFEKFNSEKPQQLVGEIPYPLKVNLGFQQCHVRFFRGMDEGSGVKFDLEMAGMKLRAGLCEREAKMLLQILLQKYVLKDMLGPEAWENCRLRYS